MYWEIFVGITVQGYGRLTFIYNIYREKKISPCWSNTKPVTWPVTMWLQNIPSYNIYTQREYTYGRKTYDIHRLQHGYNGLQNIFPMIYIGISYCSIS